MESNWDLYSRMKQQVLAYLQQVITLYLKGQVLNMKIHTLNLLLIILGSAVSQGHQVSIYLGQSNQFIMDGPLLTPLSLQLKKQARVRKLLQFLVPKSNKVIWFLLKPLQAIQGMLDHSSSSSQPEDSLVWNTRKGANVNLLRTLIAWSGMIMTTLRNSCHFDVSFTLLFGLLCLTWTW